MSLTGNTGHDHLLSLPPGGVSPSLALPCQPGELSILQTQRGLSLALRGVQTVLSSPQPVAIFLSALPDVIHASDLVLHAAIHQDVVRDVAHHTLLFSDRVCWVILPTLFLAHC